MLFIFRLKAQDSEKQIKVSIEIQFFYALFFNTYSCLRLLGMSNIIEVERRKEGVGLGMRSNSYAGNSYYLNFI
jgi:hypothetical protein